MRSLAAIIMRGRLQAALVIALLSPLPLLNILSGAAVSLVTLRQGSQEGMLVILLAAGIGGSLFLLLSGSVIPVIGLLVLIWLPLWMLATLLRYTVSLAKTLELGLLLFMLVMLGYAVYLGDFIAWGRSLLERWLKPFLEQTGIVSDNAVVEQALAYLAPFTLGLIFANGLLSLLCSLLLGRWWQALLFNPGGFRREFHELRLGRQTALVALVVVGLAFFSGMPLFIDVALLIIVVFALQGIAVVHGAIARARLTWGWLVVLYALLVLALPQLLVLLCLLGISDAWLDFRARIKPPAQLL
jgi:hypothetical protein